VGRPRIRIRPWQVRRAARFTWKVARKALMSTVLLAFLSLCLVGFLVGREQVPHPVPIPTDQLFDNLQVYSYKETPADTSYHFVVELTAFGKTFAEYDVDQRRFLTSGFGRRYDRAFSGAHYRRMRLRGHSGEGSWVAMPESLDARSAKGQFDELARRTLDYVRPVGVVTSVLGLLSGYSIGYRLGLWEASVANPGVQRRLLASPGIADLITREAWRRVLLEPAFMTSQPDPASFATVLEQQRIYNRFYLLALEDTSGFLSEEAARLAAAGQPRYAAAMTAFVETVRRVKSDSTRITSRDFRAIEEWAGTLFSRGHWANYVRESSPDSRYRYLGVLAHYGLNPPQGPTPTGRHARQMWVGPRALVTADGDDGYISDEIPATKLGCPVGWTPWLQPGERESLRNLHAVRWVNPPGWEFVQVAKSIRRVAVRAASLARGGREPEPDARLTELPSLPLERLLPRPAAVARGDDEPAEAPPGRDSSRAMPEPIRAAFDAPEDPRRGPPADSFPFRHLPPDTLR
jgi:hypothetical protein